MLRVERTGRFTVALEDLCLDNKEREEIIRERVKRFQKNPNDTRLENHPLTKRLEGKWAFSITADVRIVYEWVGENTVRFLAIGPHKAVYKK